MAFIYLISFLVNSFFILLFFSILNKTGTFVAATCLTLHKIIYHVKGRSRKSLKVMNNKNTESSYFSHIGSIRAMSKTPPAPPTTAFFPCTYALSKPE